MSSNDSHARLTEIFSAALELPPEKRDAFLETACDGDVAVRREIDSLLASFAKSEDFIESPAARLDEFLGADQNVGKTVGNYRIIREIGHGGMGAVYLAARADGVFEKDVAIKLSRQTIADRDSATRFLEERRILARLQHPNIATLVDGGVTADGQPFLAMEYIDGLSITDFCEQNGLALKERLKLFLKVCRAVAYAHRNLVVHRDIKPSNILVTPDGEPKLLDFGLARLFADSSDVNRTVTVLRALTPAYASPEQLHGQSITTASDIYSLGVILYEILTGARPFPTDGKSLDEIIRTVANAEPPTPSAVGRRLAISGDIDNVILMALRKEPERRYASVEEFARDVGNCLDGLPVIARPNTFSYRAGKFVRRNRIAVVAALLIVAALVGGIVVSLRQTRLALASRAAAERESAKSRKITAFMEKILNYANPSWYAEGRRTYGEAKLSDVLDEVAGQIETEFPDDLDVQAEIHHKYAEIYLSKNQIEKGMFHAERALELRRRLYGEENAEVAKDLYYLSAAHSASRHVNVSMKLGEEAAAIFHKVDPDNANLPYLLENLAASKRLDFGDPDAALAYSEESLRLFRRRDGENHFNTIRQILSIGIALTAVGRTTEGETVFRDGETRLLGLAEPNLRNQIFEFRYYFEVARGKTADGQKIVEDCLPAIAADPADAASYGKLIALLEKSYIETRNYEKCVALLRTLLSAQTTRSAPDMLSIGEIKARLAVVLFRLGRKAEAERELAAAMRIAQEAASTGVFFKKSLGQALFLSGRFAEAENFLAAAIEFMAANVPPNAESKELVEMFDKTRAALKE